MIRSLVLAGAGVALVAVLLVWFYPPTDDWDEGNPFWNGLAAFHDRFGVKDVTGATLPRDPTGTMVVVVPSRPALPSELAQLRDYVTRGGHVLLLDDQGYGNDYAAGLEIAVQFDHAPLLDPLINYRQARLPRAGWTRSNGRQGSLVLNGATALLGTDRATVLARSSPVSFLDRVGSGVKESADPAGPLPVAVSVGSGRGRVDVVASGSLPMNAMLGLGDNEVFLRELVGTDQVYAYTPGFPVGTMTVARGALQVARQLLGQPALSALLCGIIVVVVLIPGRALAALQRLRPRHMLPGGLHWLRARRID